MLYEGLDTYVNPHPRPISGGVHWEGYLEFDPLTGKPLGVTGKAAFLGVFAEHDDSPVEQVAVAVESDTYRVKVRASLTARTPHEALREMVELAHEGLGASSDPTTFSCTASFPSNKLTPADGIQTLKAPPNNASELAQELYREANAPYRMIGKLLADSVV